MPDCRYCNATFDDEDAYLDHLGEAHADELGPIDRRRIDDDGGWGLDPGPIALGGVLAVSAALVAYLVFFAGSGGGSSAAGAGTTPHSVGSVHYHGTIEMTVNGESVDFGDPKYVRPSRYPAFHFDRPDDPNWHVHARGVTLAYALGTLGIDVSETSVTFEGTTYRESEGATVTVEVDGESVDPGAYVLQQGDHIRIVVHS